MIEKLTSVRCGVVVVVVVVEEVVVEVEVEVEVVLVVVWDGARGTVSCRGCLVEGAFLHGPHTARPTLRKSLRFADLR